MQESISEIGTASKQESRAWTGNGWTVHSLNARGIYKLTDMGTLTLSDSSVVSNNDCCFNENSIYEHYDHFCLLIQCTNV